MTTDTTGNQSETGYRIEARDASFSHVRPLMLADGVLGPNWREVQFAHGTNPAGIPCNPFSEKRRHGLLSHEAATALAWTLVAQNRYRGIEARLVRYKLVTTFKLHLEGIVDAPVIKHTLARDIPLVGENSDEATK